MNRKKFENDYVKMWLDEKGILHNEYKNKLKINSEVAKQLIKDRIYFTEGISRPMFMDLSTFLDVDREARRILSRDGTKLITAGAFYSPNQIGALAIRIFIGFDLILNGKTPFPVKAFSQKKKALVWLESFLVEKMN